MLKRKKNFIPSKYIKNQINENNCNHELLITSCFDDEENNKNYKCLICDKDIIINNKEDVKDKYVYYDLFDTIDVSFLKKLLRYISLKSIKSRGINIVRMFRELEPEFEKISVNLNEKVKETENIEKTIIAKNNFKRRLKKR